MVDDEPERAPQGSDRARRRAWAVAPWLLAGLALALRLDGLGERMLSHPENFAPGLPMPDWVRFPPPRHDLTGVLKGTLIDGHPPTYFVGLLAWTRLFGASLVSLRLPSALLGALSVWLLYRVGRREAGRGTALFGAALLALNGFHLYWSQLARMYVPTACLGLVSTLCLWRLVERGRAADRPAYLASTVLALWTQLYAWPLVLAQMAWSAARGLASPARARRAALALRVQLLAVALGLPVVQLSIFQDPPSRWREDAGEYLSFGYLLNTRAPFFGDRPELGPLIPALMALGAALLAAAALAPRARGRDERTGGDERAGSDVPPRSWRAVEWLGGLGTTGALAAFAAYARHYPGVPHAALWALAPLALALAAALPALERVAAALCRRPPPWLGRLARGLERLPPSLLLATLPVAVMLAVSLVRPAFVARGTVVFLPYLCLAMAQGLAALVARAGPLRAVGLVAGALVLAAHLGSVAYFQRARSSPRDYAGLAHALDLACGPEDLLLVRNDFGYPPLVYYLRGRERLVHARWSEAVAARPPGAAVWLVNLSHEPPPEPLAAAVEGLRATAELERYGIRALRYEAP